MSKFPVDNRENSNEYVYFVKYWVRSYSEALLHTFEIKGAGIEKDNFGNYLFYLIF